MSTTDWAALHLLAEPTRRRLFEAVRAARVPLTRDEAAAGAGVSRRLAAFHLDHLAEAGLLEVDYARPPERRGPGAGRPAKRYRVTPGELALSVPPRRYDLAARLLAAGIRDAEGGRHDGDARQCALDASSEEGRRIGRLRQPARMLSVTRTLTSASEALDDMGYEPALDGEGVVRLRNCPFHAVVDVSPQLVCAMNERLVEGLLEGMGGHPDVRATLDPAPSGCCVAVHRRSRPGS